MGSTRSFQVMSYHDLILHCQDKQHPRKDVFSELVRRYNSHVERVLYHLAPDWNDRADLAQEVWIRVYRNLKNLREPSQFRAWLSRIIVNLFYDELRKRKRIVAAMSLDSFLHSDEGEIGWEIASHERKPLEELTVQEFYDELQSAIVNLPEIFQATIVLRELEGLSYEEIGRITGVPISTVKSRILRARKRLQKQLKTYFDGSS
ncbi:MAG TPA: sigma-70 family RNA polymerase sigma factor [Trichocoleus sp.]